MSNKVISKSYWYELPKQLNFLCALCTWDIRREEAQEKEECCALNIGFLENWGEATKAQNFPYSEAKGRKLLVRVNKRNRNLCWTEWHPQITQIYNSYASKSPMDFHVNSASSELNGGSEDIPVFKTCFEHTGMLQADRRKLNLIRKWPVQEEVTSLLTWWIKKVNIWCKIIRDYTCKTSNSAISPYSCQNMSGII